MDEDAAFLDAIKAAPGDLLPRLVYADWLEERGDPRGEYLRLDCQLHQLIGRLIASGAMDDPALRRLRSALAKVGRTIDPAWRAIFEAIRPAFLLCKGCRAVFAPKDAIATHPRTHRKMTSTRYCRRCYEDAVRSYLHRGYDDYADHRRKPVRDDE